MTALEAFYAFSPFHVNTPGKPPYNYYLNEARGHGWAWFWARLDGARAATAGAAGIAGPPVVLSDAGKAFFERVLIADPAARPTAAEVAADPWLIG